MYFFYIITHFQYLYNNVITHYYPYKNIKVKLNLEDNCIYFVCYVQYTYHYGY